MAYRDESADDSNASFFGSVFAIGLAISGIIRWPLALIYPVGAILYLIDLNILGFALWVVFLGPIVTLIVEVVALIPCMFLAALVATVVTALRVLFRFETGLFKKLPIEVRRRPSDQSRAEKRRRDRQET